MKIASQNRASPISSVAALSAYREVGSGAMARSGKRLVFPATPFDIVLFCCVAGNRIAEGTKRLTCPQRVR
jgi:hypothetical protein